mgnify:CR=1 FL=1
MEIDPVKYGTLWQKVSDYDRRFDVVERKIDKMERQLEELLALANRGRGGLWFGMMVASGFSAVVGFVIAWLKR